MLFRVIIIYFISDHLLSNVIFFSCSVGCGETKAAVSESFLASQADLIAARNRAEKDLRMYTNLEWTIIRTGKELILFLAIVVNNVLHYY